MSDLNTSNPHKEEDEGYLAAESGRTLSQNIYPSGTIRFDEWRRGWRIKADELRRAVKLGQGLGQDDEGYRAADAGAGIAENPYPLGTLRHDDWRRGWRLKKNGIQRAIRLNRKVDA